MEIEIIIKTKPYYGERDLETKMRYYKKTGIDLENMSYEEKLQTSVAKLLNQVTGITRDDYEEIVDNARYLLNCEIILHFETCGRPIVYTLGDHDLVYKTLVYVTKDMWGKAILVVEVKNGVPVYNSI